MGPTLTNIRKIAGIVTYGRPRYMAFYMSDPPRKVVRRYLKWFTGGARTEYHALYHLNVASDRARHRFLERVRAAMAAF